MRFAFLLLLIGPLCAGSGTGDQFPFEALANGERAVRLHPDSEADRMALAAMYLKTDRYRNAVETLSEFLRTHPGSSNTLKLLAAALLHAEDYQSAKTYAARAVAAAPKDAAAVHLLAMAEMGLQDTNAAERLLRESLKLDPNLVDSNFQLGLLYVRRREHLEDAFVLLQKARATQPRLSGIHTALGSAFLQSGKVEEAVQSLETAVKLEPESAETWYVLADAYRRTHQDGKAEDALQRFEQLNTALADRRAREMRSRAYYDEGVNLLSASDQIAQLNQAYDLFNKAVGELPTMDAGYYRMAQVDFLTGNMPRALVSIRAAIRMNPLEPEYYYVQAQCLAGTNDPAALESARKAVALRPGLADFEELLRDLEAKKQ